VGLGQTQLHAKFEVVASAVAQILKGNPKILGSSYSTGPRPLSSVRDFMIGLGKRKQHANFEVAKFSLSRNIIGER